MASWDIRNHLKSFPHAAMMVHEERLYGCWFIGNNYKRVNGYHGEYPPTYVKRVKSLFPNQKECLHVFSGSVTEDATFDINPESKATWKFDFILADPPYTLKDADIYGYKMPRKNIVMQEIRKIITNNGVLVWLDLRRPMYRKSEWKLTGTIGLDCGTNRLFRGVFIFEPR